MLKGTLLSAMILLAVNAHAGQFDKGGSPYILHPLAVMHQLNSIDEELNCIALGHDLFEDTYVTEEILRQHGMTPRIVAGIKALTRQKGQSEEEYRQQVLANPDAIIVKMSDLRHNSDLRRLKGVREKDLKRIVRYCEFYTVLKEAA